MIDFSRRNFFIIEVEVRPVEKTDNFIDTEPLPDRVGRR
jgi:hypothetical protein